jgi:hypothetical protein
VGVNSLKSLNLTNGYPNNKNKNNKVKSKLIELFELAGKNRVYKKLNLIAYGVTKIFFKNKI